MRIRKCAWIEKKKVFVKNQCFLSAHLEFFFPLSDQVNDLERERKSFCCQDPFNYVQELRHNFCFVLLVLPWSNLGIEISFMSGAHG